MLSTPSAELQGRKLIFQPIRRSVRTVPSAQAPPGRGTASSTWPGPSAATRQWEETTCKGLITEQDHETPCRSTPDTRPSQASEQGPSPIPTVTPGERAYLDLRRLEQGYICFFSIRTNSGVDVEVVGSGRGGPEVFPAAPFPASLRGAVSSLPGARKANSSVSFHNEKMEAKMGGHNEEGKQASEMPRGGSAEGVKCWEPAEALFGVITCLIYFASQKLSAMTEPIYSDPRVSVRQTKGRLQ